MATVEVILAADVVVDRYYRGALVRVNGEVLAVPEAHALVLDAVGQRHPAELKSGHLIDELCDLGVLARSRPRRKLESACQA